MAEDPRDEETRQHDVPAGYEDDQPTAHGQPPPPPPPPPGYDEQPTEVGRDAYVHDETETGDTVTDEHDAIPYDEEPTQVDEPAASTQDQRAQATQGSVKTEPEPPSGDEDDEYRWHTERTARSERPSATRSSSSTSRRRSAATRS